MWHNRDYELKERHTNLYQVHFTETEFVPDDLLLSAERLRTVREAYRSSIVTIGNTFDTQCTPGSVT